MRTYLVVSGRLGEEIDVMAADWVTVVSAQPLMVAVSIAPSRYTFKLVKSYREFVISVPSVKMLKDVWITGSESGPAKLSKTKLEFAPANKVKVPIIKNALANLECRVVGEHPYGDHVLFVGDVLAYHYSAEAYENWEPKPGAGFLAHLAWNKFITFAEQVLYPEAR